jgi:hypothetical protein
MGVFGGFGQYSCGFSLDRIDIEQVFGYAFVMPKGP